MLFVAATGLYSSPAVASDPTPAITSITSVNHVTCCWGGVQGGERLEVIHNRFNAEVDGVYFGSQPAEFWFDSASSRALQVITPPNVLGPLNIWLDFGAGGTTGSSPDTWYWYTGHQVNDVSPGGGPTLGGNVVTIEIQRAGLPSSAQVSAVRFGTTPAAFNVESTTRITATAPPHTPGLACVYVDLMWPTYGPPGGHQTVTSINRPRCWYSYQSPPSQPAVTGLSHRTSPTTGGGQVTITGTAFDGATAVRFGTTPTTFSTDGPNQITAEIPPRPPGLVCVYVDTPSGTSQNTGSCWFRYDSTWSG